MPLINLVEMPDDFSDDDIVAMHEEIEKNIEAENKVIRERITSYLNDNKPELVSLRSDPAYMPDAKLLLEIGYHHIEHTEVVKFLVEHHPECSDPKSMTTYLLCEDVIHLYYGFDFKDPKEYLKRLHERPYTTWSKLIDAIKIKYSKSLDDILPLTPDFRLCKKDLAAKKIMPREYAENGLVALKAVGDGNCLFHAVSIAICGTDIHAPLLRLFTVVELYENPEFYATHPFYKANMKAYKNNDMFILGQAGEKIMNANGDLVTAVKAEARDCAKDYRYSPPLCMLGLASVIKRPIFSVFPEVKELDKLRNLMHQEVIVREEAMFEPITIMWSTLQKGVDLKKN